MNITYTELALIIRGIRDNGNFDRVVDLYDFMDRLDEQEDWGIKISKHHDVTFWEIDIKMEE